jgi:hypothetical protein
MRRRLCVASLAILLFGCTRPREPKLVILGLDAFNWHVLAPLIRSGRMPVTAEVLERGWWDVLLPEQGPIVSPRLWTSIATGRTAEGHGIWDWYVHQKGEGKHRSSPADRTCAAFWNVFSDHGLTVGVVDWMATWPPEKVNGYMVSKLFYPSMGNNTYPAELESQVWALRGEFDYDRITPTSRDDEWAQLRNRLLLKAVRYLVETRPVDVLAVFNYTPDAVQHLFWKCHEPWEFQDEAWWEGSVRERRLRDVVARHYVWCDTLLAACLSAAGPSTRILIVSDHGQGPVSAPRVIPTTAGFNRLLAALGHTALEKETEQPVESESTAWVAGVVDGHVGIVMNPALETPEPCFQSIQAVLNKLTFAHSGRPLFSFVGPCSGLNYDGLRSWSVDLCAIPAVQPRDCLRGEHILTPAGPVPVTDLVRLDTRNSGGHRPEGILVLAGPSVRARGPLAGTPVPGERTPRQVDVLPTLLYLLNLPLSRQLAGRILWEALTPELCSDRPLTYVDAYPFTPPPLVDEPPEAQEFLTRKLKALGYIQ